MFDISFGELSIILIVALLVLGPEKLPKVAKTIGKVIGQIQQHASHLKQELAREGELAELKKLHEETTRNLQEVGQQLIAPLHEAEHELQQATSNPSVQTSNDEQANLKEPIGNDISSLPANELTPPANPHVAEADPDGQLDLFASQQNKEKQV